MINLYPYQQDLYDDIRAAWKRVRSVLAVLPTGGGKTVIFTKAMSDRAGASAAVVHRREILGQISCALAKLGVKHRVVAPGATLIAIRRKHFKKFGRSFIDPHSEIGVISVQTLTSKASSKNAQLQAWIKRLSLCVFDEGHHYVQQGLWGRAVEMMTRAQLLFMTATPERADGKGLGSHADGFCDEMVLGPPPQWLIENGYLSKFIYKAPESDLNIDDIPITASGEVNLKVLRQRTVDSTLIGSVVEHYIKYAAGKKTIVYASDVQTAHEMADAFNAAGVSAEALSGETDSTIRDKKLDEFENGSLLVLVNVGLFDEGFDVPAVEWVILSAVTFSLGRFLQMVGRALRVLKGKKHAGIIDPVRNWERHGMPNWPRKWTMDSRDRVSRSVRDTGEQILCLECTQPYKAFYKSCPYCGEDIPAPKSRELPEYVGGDLVELDVEGMAALFRAINKADMTDTDFRADMVSRNVPTIGHSLQLKAHRAARYRRSVLRELVGWWVGMQPDDRPLDEKHRRFYRRFGIDIGTAFTLDKGHTDALIELITSKFSEDMV